MAKRYGVNSLFTPSGGVLDRRPRPTSSGVASQCVGSTESYSGTAFWGVGLELWALQMTSVFMSQCTWQGGRVVRHRCGEQLVGRRCTIARSYGNCTHGMCRKPCITVSHLPYPTPDPTLKETYFRDIPLVSRDIWNTGVGGAPAPSTSMTPQVTYLPPQLFAALQPREVTYLPKSLTST